jgi:hypothetical protein
VSRFVSYADFPPVLGVAPPSDRDFAFWRRRWKQRQRQKKQAPLFWLQFFAQQFYQSPTETILYNWGELIGTIKFAFGEGVLQGLKKNIATRKRC